ncbi:MAG: ATP-binding cassette domain-containing protein [Alphaproteobacteria bacterium]
MTAAALHLAGVTVATAAGPLFAPLDLAVAAGEVVSVMGPSGSGKSSLIAWVSGALPPGLHGRGRIGLGGDDVTGLPPERRRIGILFQDDLLFPHMSVGENLAFGLSGGLDRATRRSRVDAALAEAGLAGFAGRDPATLSGGQRARVALMRTLLAEPRAVLLDEPFARLDIDLRQRFRAFVVDHISARAIPALLATHDRDDAAAAGGPVVNLRPVTAAAG